MDRKKRVYLAEVKRRRAKKILQKLKKLFPDAGLPRQSKATAGTILRYKNNWELLVAVELSAQCTDVQVNKVTEKLFKKYPKFSDYLHANRREFEQDIFTTGFYRNKAKNILAAAKYLKESHKGKIPRTMEEMIKIPGVGRKTANVVLGNAYGVVEGIAVDTHVKRLARVLGLSSENTPEKIEQDLMELFPKKEWFHLTYLLIEYGRKYCVARKHDHAKCPLREI